MDKPTLPCKVDPLTWIGPDDALLAETGLIHCAHIPPDASTATPAPLVVMLHGFFCNAGFFWWLRRAIRRAGVSHVYTLNMEPPFGSITQFARQASARIEAVRRATGCRRVIVVGHSMGGLVARRMRELNLSQDAMAGLITLGTPHHGTWHARILASITTRQMRLSLPVDKETPANPWLDRLNAYESEPLPYPVTSVYSYQDNIIAPQSSAVLGMAENVPIKGVGHLEMAFSRRVADVVVRRVAAWSAGTAIASFNDRS